MEQDSGAKIAIRGKGSVKEGKGRSDAAHTSNQEEDLHCLIMADSEDKVNKAKQLINNVIETVSTTPPTPFSKADHILRPRPFLRDKTSSSATNFESSPRSTVHFVTMRTKLARTVCFVNACSPGTIADNSQVDKLDIASTTAQRSRTSLHP